MSPRWRRFLRSVQGQLTLLGVTFVGAVGLAILTIALRPVLFESYIREKYPAADVSVIQLARAIIAGQAGDREVLALIDDFAEQLASQEQAKGAGPLKGSKKERIERNRPKATAEVASTLYGYWMQHGEDDPGDALLRSLLRTARPETLYCLKRTLAVGDAEQRSRAVHAASVAAAIDPGEVRGLLEYARDRAARRGEASLAEQAQEVLDRNRNHP
jgi:hypothetical protein